MAHSTTSDLTLQPAAAAALAEWHGMIIAKDLSQLSTLLADDVQFQSPAVFKPYSGAPMVHSLLNTVIQVLEGLEYHRQFATHDGLSVVLEFKTRVADKALHGIDMIRFNEAGLITHFDVMVRPLSALQTLAAEMGSRLAALKT
jgi:SnoaL-like domain